MIVNKREDMVMNKIAKNTTLWGKWLIFFASLILCVGISATQASAQLVSLATTSNNFTMIDGLNNTFGGTNDVTFTWDGTMKTSVAVSGQVSNATISSPCNFFAHTWAAHDVTIYGPGIYTIFDGCTPGSPGCGTGNPVTFTIGAAQLGAHMLFYWNGSDNIDVVDIWQSGAFGPDSTLCASAPACLGACGSNSVSKVWDWMSTDWDGDGINGAGMTDGPFAGSDANFNLMGNPCGGNCDDNDPCTIDSCSIIDNTNGTCVHTPIPPSECVCAGLPDGPTPACNDNNACTTEECVNQVCVPSPVNCNDNNPCTTDSCDTATGCQNVNVANGTTCNDNDPNTTGDVCTNGVCAGGAANQLCSPAPTLVAPTDGQGGLGTTMELRWTKCVDPDGDPINYHITYCITRSPGRFVPSVVDVADAGRKNSKSVFYASGAGLLMIGMTFIGGIRGRKKIIALLIIVTLFAGGAFMSCKNTSSTNQGTALGANEMNYMASGLTPATTYYWKVTADDNRGGLVSSSTQSFTTQ
jgi:hypothetical protein